MKAFKAVPLIAVLALLALAPDASADVYYRMLFERAVFLLETRIEPINAVPIFQEIIRRHGDDRSYAALCQLYIGLCYMRAGSGDLAAQAFREVSRDYPEQAAVARIAEAELGGSKAGASDPRGSGPGRTTVTRLVRRFGEGQRIGGLSGNGRYAAVVDMDTGGLMAYDRVTQAVRRLNRRRLAGPEPGFAEEAAISPDGATMVFSWRDDSGRVELRSVRVDGREARSLLSEPDIAGIHPVAWRASGDRILAVLSRAGHGNSVAFISASDGSAETVLDLGDRWPGSILLSPDRRTIAYSLSEDPMIPGAGIFLYSIEERKSVPLAREAVGDRLLAWTPDGGGVVYAGRGPETAGIWLMPVRNGVPLPPAGLISEEAAPVDPIGLTEDGSLYFRAGPGDEATARPGEGRHELWVWPRLLPERSRVLTVPDAYPSIQKAIDAANAGDTVFVRAGLYDETVVIDKPLRLQGERRSTTKLVGRGVGSVVRITAGDVGVSGITVSGGTDGIEIAPGAHVRRVALTDVAATQNSRDGIRSTMTGGYHRIERCIVSDNGQYGMNVHQFLRGVIRDCDVLRNGTGLRPAWSWYLLVEGNRVHHNRSTGLLIDSCYNSTVSGNLVHANRGPGISIYYIAGRNTIKENILVRNLIGIGISLHWGGFGENRFYHNDLIGNDDQVEQTRTGESLFQLWDMGGAIGGNFWSDHPGGDGDGDGLCDLAYELTGGGRDRFPLAKPRGRIRADLAVDSPGGADATGRGDWLTVRIELAAGLPPEDIDLTTLRLNGSVPCGGAVGPAADLDEDGVPELRVRFAWPGARRPVDHADAGRRVTITGMLKSGLSFEACEPSERGNR